jgi:hypothetical protein
MADSSILFPAVLAAEHWRYGDHDGCEACDRLAAVLRATVDAELEEEA